MMTGLTRLVSLVNTLAAAAKVDQLASHATLLNLDSKTLLITSVSVNPVIMTIT
jgi:hypothetical protein